MFSPELARLLELDYTFWIFQTIAMMLTAAILPGLKITSILGTFATVVALAYVNTKLWDAALFFHIPDNISYQAIALVLANAFIFWAIVKLLPGIEIESLLSAVLAPLLFAASSIGISVIAPKIDWISCSPINTETMAGGASLAPNL